MADNVLLNSGTGGATLAADDIAGVHHQRVKIQHGADGAATDVSAASPLPVDGSGVTQPVSAATLPLPSGAATAAKQDTGNTSLATVAGAVAGAEMQVDVVGALPAGANAIGKLAANSGVDIGDVDVLSSALPTGASTLAEQQSQTTHLATIAGDTTDIEAAVELLDDTVATLGTATYTEATTKGLIVGAVRRDADTSPVGTDNEVGPLTMNALGQLKVEVFTGETLPVSLASVPSHAVTNAGAFVVQENGAALTALQLIDDPVQVLGTDTYTEATSKGVTLGAVRRDADTTLVGTTNEFAPLQVDANGRLKVEAFSGEALPVTLTSTTITGTVAATQSGTWDEVGIHDSGNSITVDAPTGTPVAVQIGNATLVVGVIDETGASAVDALAVGGGTAHDAVDSGNPLKIGAKAATAVPTAVAAADRVNIWADLYGRQVTQLGVPVGTEKWATAQYTTSQTGVALLTPTAGKKLIITAVQIQAGATTAATVQLWFGGSGDTTYSRGTDRAIFDGEFAPSATLKPGFTQTKESGWVAGAADDVLRVTTSANITITFTVWGYEV